MLEAALAIVVLIESVVIIAMIIKKRPKYDGSMVIRKAGTKKMYSLELDTPIDDLSKQREILMKVVDESS